MPFDELFFFMLMMMVKLLYVQIKVKVKSVLRFTEIKLTLILFEGALESN